MVPGIVKNYKFKDLGIYIDNFSPLTAEIIKLPND